MSCIVWGVSLVVLCSWQTPTQWQLLHFSPFFQTRQGIQTTNFSAQFLGDWHLLVGALQQEWFMVKRCLSSLGTQGTRLRKLMKRKTLLMREIYGKASQRDKQGVSAEFTPLACSETPDCLITIMIKSWEPVTLVNPQVDLVSMQKDTAEFSLWDQCAFHYGNNGVAGAKCLCSRSSWFCFDGETWQRTHSQCRRLVRDGCRRRTTFSSGNLWNSCF